MRNKLVLCLLVVGLILLCAGCKEPLLSEEAMENDIIYAISGMLERLVTAVWKDIVWCFETAVGKLGL